MIELTEGRLGGGKTYSAVAKMAYRLAQGDTVVTNVKVKPRQLWEFVAEVYGVDFDQGAYWVEEEGKCERDQGQLWLIPNAQIREFQNHVPWGGLRGTADKVRVLVVLDEAHLYFNARDWNQTDRALLAFLTQSDKVSVDVLFISQSILNIDKQFARLVQYIWRYRDLSKWKIPGLGIRYPGNQILCCQYDYDGKTLLERRFVGKDRRIFRCYETAALLTDFPNTAGKVVGRRVKRVKRKNPMVKYLIVIGILVGCFCAWNLREKLTHLGAPAVVSGRVASPASVVSSGAVASHPLPPIGERLEPRVDRQRAYEVYAENFRGFMSDPSRPVLHTDQGWYVLGEMSPRGLVVGVSERRAKILLPDGRTGWVVGQEIAGNVPHSASPVSVSASVSSGSAPVVSLPSGSVERDHGYVPKNDAPGRWPVFEAAVAGSSKGGGR